MTFEYLRGKTVLVTGAGGTIGSSLVARLLGHVKSLRCVDHSEAELHELQRRLWGRGGTFSPQVGDIRDLDRIRFALNGVDVVFHTAALKHVGLGEYNPFEVVQTNLVGLNNVIRASLDADVERFVFTSSDKAVNPTNVMGASKMMGERLVSAANEIRGLRRTRFASVRFGNVLGSRGSVVPIFASQILQGAPITLTDEGMTRYVMTVREAGELVLDAGARMRGGEVFVTKMRALRIVDLAQAMARILVGSPCATTTIGPRAGEKLYEELISADERPRTIDLERLLVVPAAPVDPSFASGTPQGSYGTGKLVEKDWNSERDTLMSREDVERYLLDNEVLAAFMPPSQKVAES